MPLHEAESDDASVSEQFCDHNILVSVSSVPHLPEGLFLCAARWDRRELNALTLGCFIRKPVIFPGFYVIYPLFERRMARAGTSGGNGKTCGGCIKRVTGF